MRSQKEIHDNVDSGYHALDRVISALHRAGVDSTKMGDNKEFALLIDRLVDGRLTESAVVAKAIRINNISGGRYVVDGAMLA